MHPVNPVHPVRKIPVQIPLFLWPASASICGSIPSKKILESFPPIHKIPVGSQKCNSTGRELTKPNPGRFHNPTPQRMKPLPTLLLALLLTTLPSVAQEKLTPDESNSIRTFTPAQFNKEESADPKDGELVRIRFNGRGDSLSNGRDGTKRGRLIARSTGNDYYIDSPTNGIDVIIPDAAMEWFQHVAIYTYQAYDRVAIKSYVVYGRVKVTRNGQPAVLLVGTEIKHDDIDGDSIVWNQQ